MVDEDRQFFATACGLPEPFASRRQTPLSHSFCQHVVISNKPLIIEGCSNSRLGFVKSGDHGPQCDQLSRCPIGVAWGNTRSLVRDQRRSQKWSDRDLSFLQGFAKIIEQQIDARQYALRVRNIAHENATLAKEYHHRVKNALSVSTALVTLSAKEATSIPDLVSKTNGRLSALAKAHDTLLGDIETIKLEELAQKLLSPYATQDTNAEISWPQRRFDDRTSHSHLPDVARTCDE